MQLTQLVAKPKLVKVEINDEEIIKEFGEPLEFYVWDRQNMDTFVRMATIDYTKFAELTALVQELVLDKDGQPVITNDNVLPTKILMKAINAVVDTLGKSVSPSSTKKTKPSK